MAKRRKLELPDKADLDKLEEGFAAKPLSVKSSLAAPIAQVAADSAQAGSAMSAAERAAQAKDGADAEAWRVAQADGRVLLDLPLGAIQIGYLSRDRVSIMREELDELKHSLVANGQRLPIEVVPLEDDPGRYGLISGWRRYTACRELQEFGLEEFGTIKALVRQPTDAASAYTAMVEENEIRASLSPYERGRVAVVAAGQGAFATPDAAVNEIFAAASKAKRSKIRSFALVHEELGDLLNFGEDLSERAGLRLANAIREGYGETLRDQLERGSGESAAVEWAVMEEVVLKAEDLAMGPDRSGRARQKRHPAGRTAAIELANGASIESVKRGSTYSIDFKGKNVDEELIDTVMLEIKRLLG
ncbi:MAG: ParB N-terminal domain-containing protein [Pseudomonadota bacterium]